MSVGMLPLIPDSFKILMRLLTFLLLASLTLFCAPAMAQNEVASESINGKAIIKSGLPLPRFVSLKSDKVYVRTGPSVRYPIRWIYQKAELPVEIVEEFDVWRKIRDSQGEGGWVSQTLLSGERTVIVKGEDLMPAREKPDETARMVVRLEPGVVARVEKCDAAWCRVSVSGFKGWIERKSLWGIYENEELN